MICLIFSGVNPTSYGDGLFRMRGKTGENYLRLLPVDLNFVKENLTFETLNFMRLSQ